VELCSQLHSSVSFPREITPGPTDQLLFGAKIVQPKKAVNWLTNRFHRKRQQNRQDVLYTWGGPRFVCYLSNLSKNAMSTCVLFWTVILIGVFYCTCMAVTGKLRELCFYAKKVVSENTTKESCVSDNTTKESCVSDNTTKESCVSDNTTKESCVSDNTTKESCVSDNTTKESCVSDNTTKESCVSDNTTKESCVSDNTNKQRRLQTFALLHVQHQKEIVCQAINKRKVNC